MEILALGEKIKRRRKELEMTLKELAGNRITPGQISLVESGRSNPSMDLLEYLAETLQTSVEYLIESEESQADKISMYYEKLAESYILSGKYSVAQEYINNSLEYSEKYNLECRKAKAFFLQAKIDKVNGEYESAKELLLLASEIFTKVNNYEKMMKIFFTLGEISLESKSYNSARSYLRQAEKVYIYNNMTDNLTLALIYYLLAKCYLETDNKKEAIRYSDLVNEKLDNIRNKEGYAKLLLELSEEYEKKGDISSATKYAQKSLEIYHAIQSDSDVFRIENGLGSLFYDLDNISESLKHYNIAKKTNIEIENNKKLSILMNICKDYIKLKDTNKCQEILLEIDKCACSHNIKEKIDINILWYKVYLLEKAFLQAEQMLTSSYQLAKENNLTDIQARLTMILGKFYADNKREEEATRYLEEGIKIFKGHRLLMGV